MKQEISPKLTLAIVGALVVALAIGLYLAFGRGAADTAGRTAEEVGLGEPVQPGMPGGTAPDGPAGGQ